MIGISSLAGGLAHFPAVAHLAHVAHLARVAHLAGIAGVVAFLAGVPASYVTGEQVRCDGGMVAGASKKRKPDRPRLVRPQRRSP